MPATVHRSIFLLLAAAFVALVTTARAQETVALDFPLSAAESGTIPSGLSAWPTETSVAPASLEIPFQRVNNDTTALVSVVFLDTKGLVLRAKWVADGVAPVELAANLSEGVEGWNQRVVVLPYELLGSTGTLVLETDSAVLPVRRVVLHWTWPESVYAGTAAQEVAFVQSPGKMLTKRELAPAQSGTTPDTWSEGVWKAPLDDGVENLTDPLELDFPMTKLPQAAVLRAKINGLPIGSALTFSVNGHELDSASVEVPELATAGYFTGPDGKLNYAGWRDVALSIPAEDLQVGANAIVIQSAAGGSVKETALELSFDQETAPFQVAPSAIDPLATGGEPQVVIMHAAADLAP